MMNKRSDESLHLSYLMELSGFFHRLIRLVSGPTREGKINGLRYYILKMLEQKGKLNLTEISDALIFKKNTLSQLLDRMVNDQLIDRYADTGDRRKIILFLTPKGEEAIEEFEKICIANYKKYALNMPGNDKKEFIDAVEVLVRILNKNREEIDSYFAKHPLNPEDM